MYFEFTFKTIDGIYWLKTVGIVVPLWLYLTSTSVDVSTYEEQY